MAKPVSHKVTWDVFRSPWKVYDIGTACGRMRDLIVMTKSWDATTCKRCLKLRSRDGGKGR